MKYVIAESYDRTEVNKFFNSDMVPKIGRAIKTKSGKWYRIKDVGWIVNAFDHSPDIRVLLKRIR